MITLARKDSDSESDDNDDERNKSKSVCKSFMEFYNI